MPKPGSVFCGYDLSHWVSAQEATASFKKHKLAVKGVTFCIIQFSLRACPGLGFDAHLGPRKIKLPSQKSLPSRLGKEDYLYCLLKPWHTAAKDSRSMGARMREPLSPGMGDSPERKQTWVLPPCFKHFLHLMNKKKKKSMNNMGSRLLASTEQPTKGTGGNEKICKSKLSKLEAEHNHPTCPPM